MTENTGSLIPDDLRAEAEEIHRQLEWTTSGAKEIAVIARALLAEREAATKAERERAVNLLSGVSEVLAKHMVDQLPAELIEILAAGLSAEPEGA